MGLENSCHAKDEAVFKVPKLRSCNGTGKWDISFFFFLKKDSLLMLGYIFKSCFIIRAVIYIIYF